jgi:hypothetical protein
VKSPRWGSWDDLAPEALAEATLELHWAVQLIAAAGQTFAEPREDDSHRAMTWDPRQRAFVGSPFAGAYPFRVAIRPDDLALLILDRVGGALGTLPLEGHTLQDGLDWLGLGVATYLGGAPPTLQRPEWEMPDHPLGERGRFGSASREAREALGRLYHTAEHDIQGLLQRRGLETEIRCWPHHFDLAALIPVTTDAGGQESKSVGVGFSPRGGGYDRWYLYASPWPRPGTDSLRELEGPGCWHVEGWTGAVLTADAVMAIPVEERGNRIETFLDDAVDAAVASL